MNDSPFDLKVRASKLKLDDSKDYTSLLPGFMVRLREIYIQEILREFRRLKRYRKFGYNYESILVEVLEDLGLPRIVTLTEDLLRRAFEIDYKRPYYGITISTSARLSEDCRLSIDKYLRLIEYGTRGLPPMRCIQRARRTIESHLSRYWDEYYYSIGDNGHDRYRNLRQSGLRIFERHTT